MADNKVTFGLDNVHIAFQGVSQVESIEVTHGCSTDGEITFTITSAAVTGSPVGIVVPLSTESHGTAAKVASAIVNAINNNAAVSAAFAARVSGAAIYLTAKVAATNDSTLAMAATVGSTGVTVGSSTNVSAGATGFGAPVKVPGAVRFTPSAEGQSATFYADNNAYFVYTANNGYTAELEMALVPDAMLAEMLGWPIDDNGALIEISDGITKKFALMGQVRGDQKNRRFVYYDCQASRPAKEQATQTENVEPKSDVLNLTIASFDIDGRNVIKGTLELSDSNTAEYNAFFDSVYTPTFS